MIRNYNPSEQNQTVEGALFIASSKMITKASLLLLLVLVCGSTLVKSDFDFETLNGDDFEIIDPYVGEARFFGNISNIFNSSIISIVAIFIGGIILFGELEMAH